MSFTRHLCAALLGLALLSTGAARAQDVVTGTPTTYRVNPQRTGYAYDPAQADAGTSGFFGLPIAQMPAYMKQVQDRTGKVAYLPNPDLTWVYPLDLEGGSLDEDGNTYPTGYTLDQIHSSPTVGDIDAGTGAPVLSVMFGSGSTVRRDLRNNLYPNSPDDPTDGRAGLYTTNGVYHSDQDPYTYLQRQMTGAVFAVEGFGGTTEEFDAGGPFERRYKPLWWYGVRNLPYYLAGDDSSTLTGNIEFHESPSQLQHRFFINVSDSLVRAFDYAPTEALDPGQSFGPEPTDDSGAQKLRRQKILTQYLAPSLKATTLKGGGADTGDGFDTGAGWVGKNRPDIPERATDRLYSLTFDPDTTQPIVAERFGLYANRDSIARGQKTGQVVTGPVDNRFRQSNGMGAVNSTGAFVRLPNTVDYVSRFYNLQADDTPQAVDALRRTRRDPAVLDRTGNWERLTTGNLYIVGSDDGYVYAFDGDPRNARRVPATGGTPLTSTYVGRLVWAFRAAVRAPVYTIGTGTDRQPATVYSAASGENPGQVVQDGGGNVHVTNDNSALVAPDAAIVSGAIISSPVSTIIDIPAAPSILSLSGKIRAVVYVGSAIGRVFCLDAATGQEIWEFKTTPRSQAVIRKDDGTFDQIDSVAGYAVTSSPTLGYLPAATSQLRPTVPVGRLAVFFSADDGKVYALDAADGSPIRNGSQAAWDEPDHLEGGTAVVQATPTPGTRYQLDHFGFVTYSFERSGKLLPSTDLNGRNTGSAKFGRRRSDYAKALPASVVARPAPGPGYLNPLNTNQTLIPVVDRLFISSPTNQQDASVGNEPGFTGGTIFAVDPQTAKAVWTFDRWEDVTRANNADFDKDPTKDRFVRPSAFNVTPAFASNIRIFDDAAAATGTNGTLSPLENQNVLFAVDSAGLMFALKTDDGAVSVSRMYWRYPYPLPSSPGAGGNVYSSPVVSSPITEGTGNSDYTTYYGQRAYVFIGLGDSIAAVDPVATRTDALVTKAGVVLPTETRYTGGEISWGWTTPRDTVALDDQNGGTPVPAIVSTNMPVVTTPAIHAGYLYAGADNGLMYAWSNQENGFTYMSGSGGKLPYRGAGRRRPMPERNRPNGGGTTSVGQVEFYVDIFQAGFNYFPNFTPANVETIRPTGAPAGASGGTAGPVTPQPMGTDPAYPEFQRPTGGTLEWGDPVAAVAWGPGLATAEGTVTFQLTGPSTSGSLQAGIIGGYARQIFYLNPFGSFLPPAMLVPNDPVAQRQPRNPLYNQILPPGWRGQAFTVTAFYQAPPADIPGQQQPRRQPLQRARVNASTKFYLANPLNVMAYFSGSTPTWLTVGPGVKNPGDATNGSDAVRNGNERVPVVASIIGDHGTATTSPQPSNLLGVQDRSNLTVLRAKAAQWGVPAEGLTNFMLHVRVQPAQLRWMGGPQAAYKPLLVRNQALPNGMPLPSLAPPEPLFAPQWGPQRASFWDLGATATYVGAEQPPYDEGEENRSLDYPDIDTPTESWMLRPNQMVPTERDATASDAPIAPLGLFYLRTAVPKYQPANYAPPNVRPYQNPGVGPGYYTVNPTNSSARQAAMLGWNPGSSAQAGFYGAFNDPTENNGNTQQYMGPLRTLLPTSSTLVAQEPNYLTKVFVDVNGNGTADVSAGEPYRMVVSGVQVRPEEHIRVATTTISVPQEPERAIPGGYIPFQYYYDGQTVAAGEQPGGEDRFLFGERNFYAPFDVYNSGNVNLWNVRVSKYDPMGGHLYSAGVDPATYAGADPRSNWPGSGVIKRFNLATTLDALPLPPGGGRGAPDDASLWSSAAKPRPAGSGDEGLGQRMTVKDVFAFSGPMTRPHSAAGLNTPAGRPYLTVAVPPGKTPGNYATDYGRLVLFEDSGPPYANRPYNAILDMAGNNTLESGVSSDAVVTVRVAESRLTDKVSRYAPFLPNADQGVAMAAQFPNFGGNPNQNQLGEVWSRLAQDATPAGYRDPISGNLVVFWSSNRVGEVTPNGGFQAIAPFSASDIASDKYHVFGTVMAWKDPANPPIQPGSDVNAFLSGVMSKNPWGWQYQGGNSGNFFFPNFANARWFGQPTVQPWLPTAATVNAALGLPAGTLGPMDLTYTSPAVITDFHGTSFPPVLFWTGATGVGPDARSAIFYAPIQVDAANGTVKLGGDVQAVGVLGGQRTLDPFVQKFMPRPFLITVGGKYEGSPLATSYLNGEQVIGLGVTWFGGAPGAWKLYVSTVETDNTGAVKGNGTWTTRQLPLPAGVSSALHPSVYYHQLPKVVPLGNNETGRYGVLEVAFSGYSRSGRSPDIYLARYIAAQGDANWGGAKVGTFEMLGFARKGATLNEDRGAKPLEPLLRVAGEPRPIYHSQWAAWQGRGSLGTTVYWFRKPVSAPGKPGSDQDFELYATFTARRPGENNTGTVEARGQWFGAARPGVTAFIDTSGGTVRFATTDPVASPAPLSRPYQDGGRMLQDFIYVAMNPFAMRVTTDDQISDTQPQIWLDETHEVITDPREATAAVSPANPLNIRRDRLWVLWRRGAQPEGATKESTLFYKTFRLGVDVGQTIPIGNDGRPQVTVNYVDGTDSGPVVVDAANGRLFFTSFNDGDQIRVQVAGQDFGEYTVGWIPEGVTAPVRVGLGSGPGGPYRLPLGQWVEPRIAPMQRQGDDSQPWMFKDPFSDIPPGTPEYYARGNNDMWLFWSSTRPSRAYGGTQKSPLEPDYWDPTGGYLLYSGSASDVYYTTLSPMFTAR